MITEKKQKGVGIYVMGETHSQGKVMGNLNT